jgi:hypothetical protein
MKTKTESLKEILDKLTRFNLNPEEIKRIDFENGKTIIYGNGWILSENVLLKKPDLSDQKVREHIHKRMKELSPIAKKRLGKE